MSQFTGRQDRVTWVATDGSELQISSDFTPLAVFEEVLLKILSQFPDSDVSSTGNVSKGMRWTSSTSVPLTAVLQGLGVGPLRQPPSHAVQIFVH